jgi:hypothetical protein
MPIRRSPGDAATILAAATAMLGEVGLKNYARKAARIIQRGAVPLLAILIELHQGREVASLRHCS